MAIVACSFANLDELMAGSTSDPIEVDSGGTSTDPDDDDDDREDASPQPSSDGGAHDSGGSKRDATTVDANGPDAAEPSAPLVVPPAGRYVYVHNTAAYSSGEFTVPSGKKAGIDYAVLAACGTSFKAERPQLVEMPSTIVHDPESEEGSCWTIQVDIHTTNKDTGGHQEDESFCLRDGGLYARGTKSAVQFQQWVFGGVIGTQKATATMICDSSTVYLLPGMQPGDSQLHACEGTTTATSGKFISMGGYEYLARETMTIDGKAEDVYHVRRTRAVSGVMAGQETTEFFFSVKDAMPLRIRRVTKISTPISILCIEKCDYDSYASDWLLKSRTPKPL